MRQPIFGQIKFNSTESNTRGETEIPTQTNHFEIPDKSSTSLQEYTREESEGEKEIVLQRENDERDKVKCVCDPL